MKRLSAFWLVMQFALLLLLPVFAFGQTVPAGNDTTLIAGTSAYTMQTRGVTTQYGRLIYGFNPTISKYDFLVTGKYLRANYAPIGGGSLSYTLTNSYGISGTAFNNTANQTWRADTSNLQTILNFFPKADTRYYNKTAADGRYFQLAAYNFPSGITEFGNRTYFDDKAGFGTINPFYQVSISNGGAYTFDFDPIGKMIQVYDHTTFALQPVTFSASTLNLNTQVQTATSSGGDSVVVKHAGKLNALAPNYYAVAGSSSPPSGAAGGDLTGTYPNPTVLNSSVIAKVLTGYTSGAGTVAATDNVLQAFQKINGNEVVDAANIATNTTNIALRELLSNKVTTLDNSVTHYPSTSAITTAFSSETLQTVDTRGNTFVSTTVDPVAAVSTVSVFGTSVENPGVGASVPSVTSWVPQVKKATSWTIINNAVTGSYVCDQTASVYNTTVGSTTVSLIGVLGINDENNYQVNATKEVIFQKEHEAIIAFLSVPDANKTKATSGSVTYSGSWTTGKYTISKSTTTNGATATLSLTGTEVLISATIGDTFTGSWTESIDGTIVGTYNNASGTTMAGNTVNYGPTIHIYTGLSNTSHTIVLTSTSANAFYFDWAAGLNGTSLGPVVYDANLYYQSQTNNPFVINKSTTDTYNGFISANITQLSGFGLNVNKVDVNSVVDSLTDINTGSGIGIHPNDLGYAKIFNKFMAVINPTLYAPPSNITGLTANTNAISTLLVRNTNTGINAQSGLIIQNDNTNAFSILRTGTNSTTPNVVAFKNDVGDYTWNSTTAEILRLTNVGHLSLANAVMTDAYLNIGENTASGTSAILQRYVWTGNTSTWGLRLEQQFHTSPNRIQYNWIMRNNSTTDFAALTFANGNAGIGMNDPGSPLQVNGGAVIGYATNQSVPTNGLLVSGITSLGGAYNAGLSTDYNLHVGKTAGNNGIVIRAASTGIGKLTFDDGQNADGIARIWYDFTANSMKFYTSINANAPTLALTLNSDQSATLVGALNKVTITAPSSSAILALANSSTFATSGGFSQTLTATGPTNVTLPTTGTLATVAGVETFTNKTLTSASFNGTTLLQGASSGIISLLPQAIAGTYNWNYPTTAGTAGYVLTSQGGGSSAMTWTNLAGTYAPISGSANYVQNIGTQQTVPTLWISGDIYANSGTFAGNYSGNALVVQNVNSAGSGAFIQGGTTKATSSGTAYALNITNYANANIAKFYSDEIDFSVPVYATNYNITGAGTDILTNGGHIPQSTFVLAGTTQVVRASADITAQTAAGNITTYTVGGSDGSFMVTANLNITAISIDVIQTQVVYTDETNTSRTLIMYGMGTTSAGLTTTGVSNYAPVAELRAKAGTTITVQTTLTTGAGSITFNAHGSIIQIR